MEKREEVRLESADQTDQPLKTAQSSDFPADNAEGLDLRCVALSALVRAILGKILASEIETLRANAGMHRVALRFHRALAPRFPYAIYDRVIADEAAVFRGLDCRRDLGSTRSAPRPKR